MVFCFMKGYVCQSAEVMKTPCRSQAALSPRPQRLCFAVREAGGDGLVGEGKTCRMLGLSFQSRIRNEEKHQKMSGQGGNHWK